ncbi:SCP2 sterol-binding domain-containing protein [Aestuariivirga sp.]|jgi:putative sterol carrier protein|uniref:SCP2 sterol-binding domain-containing protein n=1 Tax=Aestuariivirga sp. TaxID=2650926 RepID=UPI0037832446
MDQLLARPTLTAETLNATARLLGVDDSGVVSIDHPLLAKDRPDITIRADAKGWIRFLSKEVSLLRLLATGGLRIKGSPKLLAAFGKCFPS